MLGGAWGASKNGKYLSNICTIAYRLKNFIFLLKILSTKINKLYAIFPTKGHITWLQEHQLCCIVYSS